MCDYSLESYASRPAQAGETLVIHRFPSGSMGFVAPDNTACATCLQAGTELTLTDLPPDFTDRWGFHATERATFITTSGIYRDGLRIKDATFSMQQLPPGVHAVVVPKAVEMVLVDACPEVAAPRELVDA